MYKIQNCTENFLQMYTAFKSASGSLVKKTAIFQ